MLLDNDRPRYLPHLKHPEVLHMGLSPLAERPWIETDNDIAHYHQHKLAQREQFADKVYRALPSSLPAQRELSAMLQHYLCTEQAELYRLEQRQIHCLPGGFYAPTDGNEPLWHCSLWVADDLVIMERADAEYRLTAASLCSPSHWRLEEKFDRPLRVIHDPIPDFHQQLTPRVDRFFDHLKPEHPVQRFNWSIQESDDLNQRPELAKPIRPDTALFYRTERQTLVRLPQSGAIAFTIRVYIHPLDCLAEIPGALPALFAAIDSTPHHLADYKGFNQLAPALARYRQQA